MLDGHPSGPPEIYEHCTVVSVYCDGLHSVEVDRRGIAKLIFFADQRGSDGAMDRCIVERLILPADVLEEIATRLLGATRAAGAATAEVPSVGRGH